MKKIKLLLLTLPVLLTGCENIKMVGNKMETGSYTYYYAYVCSKLGNQYYHISGWKEYGPEPSQSAVNYYVGLELHLAISKDVIYYYEPNLSYILMKNYNPNYGVAIE